MEFSCDCCRKVFPNDEKSSKFPVMSLCQNCSTLYDYCHNGCGKLCGEMEAGLGCGCGYFLCEECSVPHLYAGVEDDGTWRCPDPNCEWHGK